MSLSIGLGLLWQLAKSLLAKWPRSFSGIGHLHLCSRDSLLMMQSALAQVSRAALRRLPIPGGRSEMPRVRRLHRSFSPSLMLTSKLTYFVSCWSPLGVRVGCMICPV